MLFCLIYQEPSCLDIFSEFEHLSFPTGYDHVSKKPFVTEVYTRSMFSYAPTSEKIWFPPGYLNDACHVEAAVGFPSSGISPM